MITVNELMTSQPRLIDPSSTLREAARHMKECACGSMVVGRKKPEGILTDRDIIIYGLAAGYDPDETPVQNIMTTAVITCFEDESIEHAADLMSQNDIRRLVVLDRDHQVVGVLSVTDIVKCTDSNAVNDEVMHHLYKYA
ncbi:MAG: CBS domain-containing protein [Bdellovibrionales bacterium]